MDSIHPDFRVEKTTRLLNENSFRKLAEVAVLDRCMKKHSSRDAAQAFHMNYLKRSARQKAHLYRSSALLAHSWSVSA